VIDFARLAADHRLRALGVIGSRARGDAGGHSDLDLVGLSEESRFSRFSLQGLVVELHEVREVLDWSRRPSWWYALEQIDVKVDDGTLSALPSLIEKWRLEYSPPLDEVRRNRDWIEAVMRKLWNAGTELETAYLITTGTWEILAGAFVAHGMPVPASSDMYRLAGGVVGEERFSVLLAGNLSERRRVALELCGELAQAHDTRLANAPR